MPDQINELQNRAQLANILDRLPDIDLATYDEPTAPRAEAAASEEQNNRWGFIFRRPATKSPKPGPKAGLQGA